MGCGAGWWTRLLRIAGQTPPSGSTRWTGGWHLPAKRVHQTPVPRYNARSRDLREPRGGNRWEVVGRASKREKTKSKDAAMMLRRRMPSTPTTFFFLVFQHHVSSEFIGKAMNKEDTLRGLPSVCTTVVAIATKFMQVMHVQKWTHVGIGGLKC